MPSCARSGCRGENPWEVVFERGSHARRRVVTRGTPPVALRAVPTAARFISPPAACGVSSAVDRGGLALSAAARNCEHTANRSFALVLTGVESRSRSPPRRRAAQVWRLLRVEQPVSARPAAHRQPSRPNPAGPVVFGGFLSLEAPLSWLPWPSSLWLNAPLTGPNAAVAPDAVLGHLPSELHTLPGLSRPFL